MDVRAEFEKAHELSLIFVDFVGDPSIPNRVKQKEFFRKQLVLVIKSERTQMVERCAKVAEKSIKGHCKDCNKEIAALIRKENP